MTICNATGISFGITWCQWYWKWHHFVFLRSRLLRLGATWSCYATDTGVSIQWCWWHLQRYHPIAYIKMIERKCSMTFWSFDTIGIDVSNIAFVRSRWLKWCTTWLFLSWYAIGTDAISNVKGTNTFFTSRQLKWKEWLFWSCDTTVIAITMSLVLVSHDDIGSVSMMLRAS